MHGAVAGGQGRQKAGEVLGARGRRRWSIVVIGVGNGRLAGSTRNIVVGTRRLFGGHERGMIRELHEHLNGRQTIHLLAIDHMLQVLGTDKMLVHVLLNVREIATDDLHELGRQMLRVQGIDASENKVVDDPTHVVLNLHHFSFLRIGCVGFAAAENGKESLATKVFWCAENAGIGKVDHGVELLQIVLHGCAGEQNAASAGK